MTKQQANALMTQLEAVKIGADAIMRFAADGTESWNVQLDTAATYTGTQIAALQNYCAQNSLTLTVVIQEMGVV